MRSDAPMKVLYIWKEFYPKALLGLLLETCAKCYYTLYTNTEWKQISKHQFGRVSWDHVMTGGEVSRLANSISYIEHNPNQLHVSYGVR